MPIVRDRGKTEVKQERRNTHIDYIRKVHGPPGPPPTANLPAWLGGETTPGIASREPERTQACGTADELPTHSFEHDGHTWTVHRTDHGEVLLRDDNDSDPLVPLASEFPADTADALCPAGYAYFRQPYWVGWCLVCGSLETVEAVLGDIRCQECHPVTSRSVTTARKAARLRRLANGGRQ